MRTVSRSNFHKKTLHHTDNSGIKSVISMTLLIVEATLTLLNGYFESGVVGSVLNLTSCMST